MLFVTELGVELNLLSPGTTAECRVDDDASVCEVHLPILEARQPGEWQAVVRRADQGPPVQVLIEVTWHNHGNGG